MVDLDAEMNAATDACPPSRIMKAGLDWEVCMAAGGIGMVRAQVFKGGFYEPVDEGGIPMWCLPCFYGTISPKNLADIVAWSSRNPLRWYRRVGFAALLGYGNVQRARSTIWDFGDGGKLPSLELHQTPRDFALAGFEGACVLDWNEGIPELEGIEQLFINPSNCRFAREVHRRLEAWRPRLPHVLLDRPSGKAA